MIAYPPKWMSQLSGWVVSFVLAPMKLWGLRTLVSIAEADQGGASNQLYKLINKADHKT